MPIELPLNEEEDILEFNLGSNSNVNSVFSGEKFNTVNTNSKQALTARAAKSFAAVLAYLKSIEGTTASFDSNFTTAIQHDGRTRYTIDLGAKIPSIEDHKGLFLSFEQVVWSTEHGLPWNVELNENSAEIVMYIAPKGEEISGGGDGVLDFEYYASKQKETLVFSDDIFHKFLASRVGYLFFRRKSYYIYDAFVNYIRQKFYSTKGSDIHMGPIKVKKGEVDAKEYYNKPSVFDHMILSVKDQILNRIRYSHDIEETEVELGAYSGYTFINTIYYETSFIPKEFKDNMTMKNRNKLFKELHSIYLEAKEELMKKQPKTVKLSATQLAEMIRKEVASVLREVERKGAPHWDITKTMKQNKDVQPPKEVDGGDTAPETLKDLMGMGGEEVLVAPDKKVPEPDPGDEKRQLEPKAKLAKESVEPPIKKENAFLMHDITDTIFRL